MIIKLGEDCSECADKNMPCVIFSDMWGVFSLCFECLKKAVTELDKVICQENIMTTIVRHKVLGICEINEQCNKLQSENPDKTSVFVEHKGKILEVSRNLITEGIAKYFSSSSDKRG